MSRAVVPDGPMVPLRPASVGALVGLLAVAAGGFAVWYGTKYGAGGPVALLDFDTFHLVGRMAWDGHLPEAYRFEDLRTRQAEMTGGTAFMPWTYPPHFDLVVALLALLPVGAAYLGFVGATLAGYLLVLRRLAGEAFPAVLVALFPVLAVTVFVGQNGGLTGALVGLFALLALRGDRRAGLPLGLMAIKPHLAVGLGVHLLLTRRWSWLAGAVAVAGGLGLLSTLAFGAGVWGAFLHGLRESGAFLEGGAYPLHRMTSAYAGLRSFGLEPRLAFLGHAAVAVAGLAAVVGARRWRADRALAAATVATLLVSPYNYDYDLPILGVALALALRGPLTPPSRRLVGPILFLTLFAGAVPMATSFGQDSGPVRDWLTRDGQILSLAPFAVLALAALLLAVLRIEEHRAGAAR